MKPIDYTAIDLLVLDVDGVLTDGSITYNAAGEEVKSFHCRDGAGMKYWKRVGKKLAIITGRGSPIVTLRAAELGVDAVHLNALRKIEAYEKTLAELNVSEDRVAVVGDDLPDIPILRRCALPVAVADAAPEVKQVASYVTALPGGKGCVREVIELILKNTPLWGEIMKRYSVTGEGKG